MFTINVNGVDHRVEAPGDAPLLFVLRNDLGLHGPQFGCGEEACGACKVLVDGAAVPSCRLPLQRVGAARVVTLEGLAEEGEPHPVQRAFSDEQAMQCGMCANGMIIEAVALVMRGNPTDDGIREALQDNLCRCGAHHRIVRAVRRAADELWR
ncbi:oxidoreductase [Rhizocola hellebori]|uniref:Oxidoreductase n=1 Tax=Rhizocola hellebori TaxID=1392758 RepID=A0A8J3Q5G7_9ACTN|nr:(2Fe-2S)-binding protein [Rhizocola hellebori]GIH03696.1 oxidoreductase [Rhizocola hellebori]